MSIIKIEYQLVRKIIGILPILLILLIALTPRLLWLDRIPTGITGDELDYVFNAKAIFLTGKDASGEWNPLSLTTPPYEVPKAELPYILISPFIGLTSFSLFNARMPFVIFNLLLLFVIYLISYKLFNKKVAVITALVFAINPWAIFFARTAYTEPIAVLFYLTALYLIISLKEWKIILAFPFLFLGFFSYIGAKLLLMPFIVICGLFAYFNINGKKYLRQYLVIFFLCLIMVFLYYLTARGNENSRLSEILKPDSYSITKEVDEARRLSMRNPAAKLYENKLTVFVKEIIFRYFDIFANQYLFLHGESRATFSVWKHGMFYYLDALFMLIGFSYLLIKKRRLCIFLTSLLLISPLPSVMSNVGLQYSLRSAMIFPILILFIACGIYYSYSIIKVKAHKVFFTLFLLFGYGILFSQFFYIYIFENPIYNSEAFAFSERIISKYISLAEAKKQKIFVINDRISKIGLLKQYLFFTNKYDRKNADLFREKLRTKDFSFGNIKFVNCNGLKPVLESGQIVVMPSDGCGDIEINLPGLSIAQLSDGGEIYKIINDRVCIGYGLPRYPAGLSLSDFEVESLGEEKFCQTFITDLNDPQLYEQDKENQDE